MKVAVLIAAYNASAFIEAALLSLLRQRGDADLDIIAVDDGSEDGTADILARIAQEAGEVRPVRIGHGGIAAARNRGLDEVTEDTDFLTFLDADDLSPAGRLAHDLRHFESDPGLDLFYGSTRMFKEADPETLAPRNGTKTIDYRGIQIGAALFRKSLVERVGRFDAAFHIGEDTDFLLRAFEAARKYLISDDISVYYRRHGGNITHDHRGVRRGMAQAMLKSSLRKKTLGDFRYPKELFDSTNVRDLLEF